MKKRSTVLGPGSRAVVWFHGCSKSCPFCIAKEMNESPPQYHLSPEVLAKWVSEIEGIDGVTLSGGEPFEQDPKSLQIFLELVKNLGNNLSVMCYTGKSYNDLVADLRLSPLLRYIDILIDGIYIHELNTGHKWRGSSNQNIYALNSDFQSLAADVENVIDRGIEIDLSTDMKLEITGIPKKGFMDQLVEKIGQSGYYIENQQDKSEKGERK